LGGPVQRADSKAGRDVIRYRTKLVQSLTSAVQRLGNVLQDAAIKIDPVASSIATKSFLALIDDDRPQALADLALGKMRPRSAIWSSLRKTALMTTTR
jgi:transposase